MTDERDTARAVLEEACALSASDESQVAVGGGRLLVARFADNRILASVEERWARLWMRAAWWLPGDLWRVGDAEGTDPTPKGLVRLARWASESAQRRPPTAAYVPLPYPDDFESTLANVAGAYDAQTATVGPSRAANAIAELALPCLRGDWTCEGSLSVRVGTVDVDGVPDVAALANVNGLFHYYKPTRVRLDARVRGPSGGLARLDADAAGYGTLGLERLVEPAFVAAGLPHRPSLAPSGPTRLLLRPAAVAALLEVLRPHFALAHVGLDNSPFAARVGTPVFGPQLDLSFDPGHPLLMARPFDHEGWPRRRFDGLVGGVLQPLMETHERARAAGLAQDGYAELIDGMPVAVPRHPVLEAGAADEEQMLSALDDGLIVGRLSGAAFVPPNSFRVTAMSGDDVYRVRGGRPEARVGTVRLVGDLSVVLGPEAVLGEAVRAWPAVAPPMVVTGFEVV